MSQDRIDSRSSIELNRNRDFLMLWAGEAVSDLGTHIGNVSLSFAAVIALGATPLQMALLAMATNLPALLFSLFTGVWVDRSRRRPLMIACDLGRFALLATFPLAALAGILKMPQLYAVIFAASLLDLVFGVAYRAYLPSLVLAEQLLPANSRLTATSSIAMVSGWSLAGWIVEWLSAPFAIGIDAVSFLASALAVAAVRKPEPAPSARSAETNLLGEVAEGARFLFAERRVRGIGIASLVSGFASGLLSTTFMLFLVNDLGFKTGPLGIMFAIGGASAFVGSVAVQRINQMLGIGPAMIVNFVLSAVGVGLIAFAQGPTAGSMALIAGQQILGGFGLTIYNINAISVVQALTPQAMLGRVMASFRFIATASLMIGALIAGFIGPAVGLRQTIVFSSLDLLVAATLLAFSPAARIGRAEELTNRPVCGLPEQNQERGT